MNCGIPEENIQTEPEGVFEEIEVKPAPGNDNVRITPVDVKKGEEKTDDAYNQVNSCDTDHPHASLQADRDPPNEKKQREYSDEVGNVEPLSPEEEAVP